LIFHHYFENIEAAAEPGISEPKDKVTLAVNEAFGTKYVACFLAKTVNFVTRWTACNPARPGCVQA
jgi:hypothetical protein